MKMDGLGCNQLAEGWGLIGGGLEQWVGRTAVNREEKENKSRF